MDNQANGWMNRIHLYNKMASFFIEHLNQENKN
jgi:dipeptidyl-peptidase-4